MISGATTRGTAENEDVYFQHTESRNGYYIKAIDNVIYYMDKINKICKTDYKPLIIMEISLVIQLLLLWVQYVNVSRK